MQISINKIGFKSYNNDNNALQNSNKSEVQDISNSNITSVPLSNYEVGQAILNRNNIIDLSKPSIVKLNSCCTLVLTNKQCNPSMHIEMVSDNTFPIKQGLFAIYSMALNDQIYEQNQNNNEVVLSHLVCTPYHKTLDFEGKQNCFLDSIKNIDASCFQTKIADKHIENAKKLAPIALFLSRKTNEYQDEMFDIPSNMLEEDYEKLVKTISSDDFIDYNNNFLKNSHLKMKIFMNKEYYKHNSEVLKKYIDSWSNYNEN